MHDAATTYRIDGSRVGSTDDFYDVIGEAVNGPGGYFGRGLDSLSDCLRGGFGTPEDGGFVFIWTGSERCRSTLGYPETVRQLEARLQRCHPSNRDHVREELAHAERNHGPTVFDWLVEIFREEQITLTLQ